MNDIRTVVQVPRLAGRPPLVGATVANWNAAEADLVSIGANDTKYKLHSLFIDMNAIAGNLTIRMYKQINGTERRFYEQTFSVAADGPGRPTIDSIMGISEVVRVTCESDNAADDGQSIGWDYVIEAM
ncbi:MAG: hypothetical protein WC359_12300 [Dehalococcoidia bacterium]|jgi:hypothetical protein